MFELRATSSKHGSESKRPRSKAKTEQAWAVSFEPRSKPAQFALIALPLTACELSRASGRSAATSSQACVRRRQARTERSSCAHWDCVWFRPANRLLVQWSVPLLARFHLEDTEKKLGTFSRSCETAGHTCYPVSTTCHKMGHGKQLRKKGSYESGYIRQQSHIAIRTQCMQ